MKHVGAQYFADAFKLNTVTLVLCF